MEDLTLIVPTSENAAVEGCLYFSSLQRGIIKALSHSDNPLSLNDILHSLSKRPCARKFIPQLVQLEKKGIISRDGDGESCMDNEYHLTPEWLKICKAQMN